MSDKDTKEKGKEEVKVEGPQGFSEMCRQMMSGGMPDCCETDMRGMMSRWMAGSRRAGGAEMISGFLDFLSQEPPPARKPQGS